MERFVARQNIQHFCERLRTEAAGENRTRLHRLLAEQWSILGFSLEQLPFIDHEIEQMRTQIGAHQLVAEKLDSVGRDSSAVNGLLDLMRQTLTMYENYRQTLLTGIDRSGFLDKRPIPQVFTC